MLILFLIYSLEISTKTICLVLNLICVTGFCKYAIIMNLIPARRFKQVATKDWERLQKTPVWKTHWKQVIVSWSGVKLILSCSQAKTTHVAKHMIVFFYPYQLTKFVWHRLRSVFNFRFTQFHNFFGLQVVGIRRRRCDSVERDEKHKRSVFSVAAAKHFCCLLSEKKCLMLMSSTGCVEKRVGTGNPWLPNTSYCRRGNANQYRMIHIHPRQHRVSSSSSPILSSLLPRLHLFAYLHQPRQLWFAHTLFFPPFLVVHDLLFFEIEGIGRTKSYYMNARQHLSHHLLEALLAQTAYHLSWRAASVGESARRLPSCQRRSVLSVISRSCEALQRHV